MALVLACLASGPLSSALAAPGWLAPVKVSQAGHSASSSQVAFDRLGDAAVVWQGQGAAYAAVRPAGGSWQSPVELGPGGDPHIASDARGDLTAVWSLRTASGEDVEEASRLAGAVWGAPVTLAEDATAPQIAVDSRGDAIAVWYNNGRSAVEAAGRPAGGQWMEALAISRPGTFGTEPTPEVALDPRGDAAAVWVQGRSFVSAYRPAGGEWEAPATLGNEGATPGQVGFDNAGDAVAVWRSPTAIQAAPKRRGAAWGAPVEIAKTANALHLTLAVSRTGAAVAAWATLGPKGGDQPGVVEAASMAPDGDWNAPLQVSPHEAEAAAPSVAFNSQGAASAIWTSGDGDEQERIETATMPSGSTWQSPVVIAEEDYSLSPKIAFDGEGDGIAVWEAVFGGISSAGFVAAPPSVNSAAIPTRGLAGRPLTFLVSPFDVWSIFGEASWEFGDGTSANGTSVTHLYTRPGVYDVTLRLSDTLGNASTTTSRIVIRRARRT